MYLKLNDDAFELELVDTEFAHYWHDEWLFAEGELVPLYFDQNHAHFRKSMHTECVEKLKDIVDRNNEVVTRLGIEEKYLYEPITNAPSMALLSRTHEKWADITKKKFEWDQLDEEIIETYTAIDGELKKDGKPGYPYINNFVHGVEFEYKHFYMHDVDIARPELGRSYQIKASDTSFKKDLVCLPYYDIGRPQFEKYQIDRTIDHPEISNYIHITNRVHFTSSAMVEDVPKSYYAAGTEQHTPVYGNHLPVLRGIDFSPYAFGEFVLCHLQHGENTMHFSRGG